MHRGCLWTALIVYLVISFLPALALPNLFRGVTGKKAR